jgi:hypothetical protein
MCGGMDLFQNETLGLRCLHAWPEWSSQRVVTCVTIWISDTNIRHTATAASAALLLPRIENKRDLWKQTRISPSVLQLYAVSSQYYSNHTECHKLKAVLLVSAKELRGIRERKRISLLVYEGYIVGVLILAEVGSLSYLYRRQSLWGLPSLLGKGYQALCSTKRRLKRETDRSPQSSAEFNNGRVTL